MKPLARMVFGPWRPDQAVRGAEGVLADVRNALWAGSHWQPQPAPAPMASQVLPTPIQGIFTTARLDGTTELFIVAAGHFYRIISRADRDDITGLSYTEFDAQETTRWRAVQFSDLLLAVNFENDTQGYDLVTGSPMIPLAAEAPRGRYIAIVGYWPVIAHTWTPGDGANAYQMRWPGLIDGVVDPTAWTPSLATQAGFSPVSDIGTINGLTGGSFGTIIGENGVTLMQGSPPWDFSTIERRIGTRAPNSVVQYRQVTYWWSPDGFMGFDGNQIRAIGTNKINDWFEADFDEGLAYRMWAHVEAKSGRVRWLYAGIGHDGSQCNRLLSYSPALDEFSVADVTAQAMGPGKSFGLTLDDDLFNDLDAFQGSLDDPALWQDQQQTALVQSGVLASLTGEPLTARFEPAEWQASPDRRALLTKAMVGHSGGTPTVQVGRAERLGDDPAWSSAHPRQADGWFRFHEPGRTHRLRVSMSGAWSKVQWLDVFGAGLGGR